MMADQAAVPDSMQLYKNGEVACQNCLDTALLGDRMHSHQEDKACIKCVNLACNASDTGTASSATFLRPLPSRLEGVATRSEPNSLERIYEGSDDYALVLSNSSPSIEQHTDELNATYAKSLNHLLKPLPEFGGFSVLMSPSTSERDVVDIPRTIQPRDSPQAPSGGRRDDSHNPSYPEDSGYGSIAANLRLPVCGTKDGTEKMAAVADDDARTTYSNVTNENHVQTRDFVYELANDIYGKLKLLMSPDDWPLISKSLPELLKAFAIRIGSDGASQASRDVMYFIHKEHWNIANQFKNLLLGMIDDGDASRVNTDTDIMSLQDKMDLVHQRKANCFKNVTDDDPNITASLLYNKMVLESKDYSWLVQRLETELVLERGETDPRSDDVPIRQQILSMLPPSNISKRRRPTHQDVVFQFPSRPIRFLPSDPILVTPSSHNIQLTNILTYFNQTWPSFGEEVLSFVSRAFGHPHFTATTDSMTLGNDAQINALFDSSFSLIRVTGPAYSVSEFGEQLAWLAAATSNPPHSTDNRVIFNKPLVTYLGNHAKDSYPPQWKSQHGLERFLNTASGLGHQGFSGEDSPCSKHSTRAMESLELSKKSKGTTEEQWYAIWEILFPEERRPLSIYVDSDQSPDFVLLREFSQRQGVSILHERIRATGRILRGARQSMALAAEPWWPRTILMVLTVMTWQPQRRLTRATQ
ncbi:hypothetical protein CEP52_013207 [Fusarium oligoseptatum]|uniref:Uncharacterized protein n=1 Tax=Fusarium oligoseptatum TaxID=2604345 RepID=A0A428SUN8_9HYPO|nr:hypothetical protein CEP52_013207 [Fusarium oligoseptatum]